MFSKSVQRERLKSETRLLETTGFLTNAPRYRSTLACQSLSYPPSLRNGSMNTIA